MSGKLRALLFAGVVLFAAAPAARGGEEARLRGAYAKAETPQAKAAVIREIGELGTTRAVTMLTRILEDEPDLWLRETAAASLGGIGTDEAGEALVAALARGGPPTLRTALAAALAGRADGRDRMRAGIAGSDLDTISKSLLVGGLAAFHDAASLRDLYGLADEPEFVIRTEALRALGRRADAVDDLPAVLARALREHPDAATTRLVLDLIEARPDPEILPTLEALPPLRSRALGEALRHAIATVKYEAARRVAEKGRQDGYGTPEPPGRPEPRPRVDLVFAVDATWSMGAAMPAVTREIRARFRDAAKDTEDVRVGIVVFRQARKGAAWAPPAVLPLTHDLDRAEAFLAAIDLAGADSQGAALAHGFLHGLERMAWRPDATKEFHLYADTKCHDFARCRHSVLEYRDDVSIRLVWCGERRLPDDVRKLGELAGNGVVLLPR